MNDERIDNPSASITIRNQSADMELVPIPQEFDLESLPCRKQKILRKGSPAETTLDALRDHQKREDEETKWGSQPERTTKEIEEENRRKLMEKLKKKDSTILEGGNQIAVHTYGSKPEMNDSEIKRQLEEDGEPMWLTDQFIEFPCIFIGLGLFFLGVITLIAVANDYFAMNDNTRRDFLIWDDDKTFAWDLQVVAEEYILANEGAESTVKPLRLTSKQTWNPILLFRARDGGSLLEKERLLKIREYEDLVKGFPGWSEICTATSITDTSCSPTSFVSPLNFLPLGGAIRPLEELTQEEIDTAFKAIQENENLWNIMQFFVEKKEVTEANAGKVTYLRAFLSLGLPIEVNGIRYNDLLDRQTDQREFIRDVLVNITERLEDFENEEQVQPQIVSEDISQMQMMDTAQQDTTWAMASILFVFVYFVYYLKSSLIAGFSILIILLSFPLSQVISEGIFKNTFYSTLHNLVIFIVLGVAADDIFVFVDAWRQSEFIDEIKADKRNRLAYSFRRASRATLTTSSTTSAAFMANAFSPIMPIASFGIYAAIIIFVNYVLIIFFLPPLIVWYERKLQGKCCICEEDQEQDTTSIINLQQEMDSNYGPVEQFFGGAWNNMVASLSYFIIFFYFIWVIVAITLAVNLSPLSTEEEFLPKDHPLMEVSSVQSDNFAGGGVYRLAIAVYWGAKDIDKDKTTRWDPVYIGEAIMDDTFDASPQEAQESLISFCQELKDFELILNGDASCWTDAFQSHLETKNLSMPLEPEQFDAELLDWATTKPEGRQLKSQGVLGFIGGKLRYMKFLATSKGNPLDPYDKKNPLYEQWEEFVEAYRETAPASLKSVRQTAGEYWAFMTSEKAFISSAFQGMVIATLFAFFILIIATGNVVQAAMSLVCVVTVIVSELAIMFLKGWEIGVTESIAMVILIGFSVDYVVHLSADYMHSPHSSRNAKMKQAYTEMGVSILSGAITTMGSGVFLFGGVIIFFQKFALMISTTIALSFFTSMLLFGAMMHAFGPQDGVGDMRKWLSSSKQIQMD